jgi:hypothetical protein
LLSCETVGAEKNKPGVYFAAAKRLVCAAADIAVYEDAVYAADRKLVFMLLTYRMGVPKSIGKKSQILWTK